MERIEIGRVVPLEQLYIGKQEAMITFGYKEHESTFKKLWSEFKNHKDWKSGYQSPTYGVPIVKVRKFEEFLIWKSNNKFR